MVNKPNDFDTVQGYGEYKPLPAGGYVCRIMGVEETVSQSGREMLKISLDIAEGEFKGRFAEMYRAALKANKNSKEKEEVRWGCIAYQLIYDPTDGQSTNRGFKSFCTAAEGSNRGFTIQWGNNFAKCFKDKTIGVIFRREQFIGGDGAAHWSTKPISFRNAENIRKGNFDVPEDKPLPNQPAPAYSGYPPAAVTAYAADSFAPPQNIQPAAAQAQHTQPMNVLPAAGTAYAADPFAPPQNIQPAAAQRTQPMNVPGLGDFEEIISDSDLPF